MFKSKNIKIVVAIIVLLVGVFVFININSVGLAHNDINVNYAYADDERKYIESIEVDCKLEMSEKHNENITLAKGEHNVKINSNEINDEFSIWFEDEEGNKKLEKKINPKEEVILGSLDGGDYTMVMELNKTSNGSVEISFNE